MKNLSKKFLGLILSGHFLGCAPELKHQPPPATKPLLGPKQTDVTLRFSGDAGLNEKLPSFHEQVFATSDVLNLIENLLQLNYQVNKPGLGKLAHNLLSTINNQPDLMQSQRFEKTPFANAIFKETQGLVSKELDSILNQMDSQARLIDAVLDERTLPAPKDARIPFLEFTEKVKIKLIEEVHYLSTRSVDPIIIDSIKSAISTDVFPVIDRSIPFIKAFMSETTLEGTLRSLEKIFAVYAYTPNKELEQDLKFGYKIANSINTMNSEQAALTLIVQFWRLMTPKERLENFKPASQDLYDYLRERSESDLDCLASDSCLDFVLLVGKKRIFSGLRDYGLPNLQRTFNEGARKLVIEKTELTLPAEIAAVPQAMKKQILPRLRDKTREIKAIRDDYEGFLRNTLASWAKRSLYSEGTQTIPFLETYKMSLALKEGKPVAKAKADGDKLDFQQTVGASFAVTALRWSATDHHPNIPDRNSLMLRTMVEQVNKLLYSYENLPPENLPRTQKQFDASAVAEMIRGVSKLSYHLRDYEPTIFDLHLGRIRVANLAIESLPEDLAQRPLFPKETFYSLAIGNAALLLKNLNTPPSPVFTVDTEDKIQWLDRAIANPGSPNVMAGVVDIVNGKRTHLVKSASLSKFLSSLVEFYKNTEKLELTQASRLIEKGPDGKTPVETIMSSRADVRNLIMGLSNFLSHQIKNNDGSTLHSINVKETTSKNTGKLYLDDQILSIDALLDSYELLQTNMYLWSAIDTYFALNKKLWSPTAEFYFADTEKSPATYPQRIRALRVIARLKNHLPPASKAQAERILHVNTKAFSR